MPSFSSSRRALIATSASRYLLNSLICVLVSTVADYWQTGVTQSTRILTNNSEASILDAFKSPPQERAPETQDDGPSSNRRNT